MTIQSLTLTDGTYSCDLVDGAEYALAQDGWAPAVAQRDPYALGGAGPYGDVLEELTIDVIAETMADLMEREQRLVRLLEQAARWADGDQTVSPVTLQITMASIGTPTLSSAVLGGMVERPRNYADMLVTTEIEGLRVQIRRRGLWLGETDTASSGSTTSGNVGSITLPDHPIDSPIQLTWTSPRATTTDDYRAGGECLIVSESAGDILVQEAEGYASGQFTSVVTTNARGGSVLRFTATASPTTVHSSALVAPPSGLSTSPGPWAVFAQARLLNASYVAALQLVALLYNEQTLTLTRQSVFGPTTGLPAEPTCLGILTVPPGDAIRRLRIDAVGANGAVAHIDVDYLVFVRLSPRVRIVRVESGVYYTTTWNNNNAMEHRIDHQLLTGVSPVMQAGRTDGTLRTPLPSQGDLVIMQRGTNLSCLWMAGNALAAGSGYGNGEFRAVSQGGSTFGSVFTATRRRGYLVPS